MTSSVLDVETLADQVSDSPVSALDSALGVVFETDQTNVRDMTAVLVEMALRFHFDSQALYRHWDQEVFSEVMVEVGDFTGDGGTPGEFDYECLEAKITSAVLFESVASAVKYVPAIGKNPRANGVATYAMLSTLSGDPALGVQQFNQALADGVVLRGLPLLFCGLSVTQALPASEASDKLHQVIDSASQTAPNDRFIACLGVLLYYTEVQCGQRDPETLAGELTDEFSASSKCPWFEIVRTAVLYWLGEKPSVRQLGRIQRYIDQATLTGVTWYAVQAGGLLRRCGKQRDTVSSESTDSQTDTWLADLKTRSVDWQMQLQKIDQLCQKHQKPQVELLSDDIRVVWFVYAGSLGIELQARQQKKVTHGGRGQTGQGQGGRSQGVWSKGRKLELLELLNDYEQLEFLCESDRQLCSAIDRYAMTDMAHNTDQRIDVSDPGLLNTLIAHPRLYRAHKNDAKPPVPCTIELTQPHLEVLQSTDGDAATVRMAPYPSAANQHSQQWQLSWVKPDLLQVTSYKQGMIDIAHTLTEAGLQVPAAGLQQLQKSMSSLTAMMTTYTDTEMPGAISLINKEPDNTLHFYVTPMEEGLRFALSLLPLGDKGPLVIPGIASQQSTESSPQRETLLATVEDAMYKLDRDLSDEKQIAEKLLQELPLPGEVGHYVWQSITVSEGFELISALQGLKHQAAGSVQLHWPDDQAISITGPIECHDMQIEVGGSFDWLHVNGELTIDKAKNRTLDIDVVIGLLDENNGRYIQPDESTVIELSEDLHNGLCRLRSVYSAGRVHPLATAALRDAIEGMTVTGSTQWQDRLQRMQEAENLDPQVPADLTATLRDYQLHGYQWMVRLAHWGAGACLADDMGLGKTFQAIAVVLQRAGEGPTLVTAPTSVCANWINECKRFAPSLNVQRLADRNRDEMLGSAAAGDVIVCSYGVLQNEIESIAEVRWATVVADEAQSFKNTNTYRSDAMMMLQSDFRLITTGTPIENRLEELWNLFRFINPELLGSRERFKTRFANPIENSSDESAREQLKALVRPFILRRLKSEVLTELPSRTEITQLVELEPDERTFYESLRTDASERIKLLDSDNPEQRFQVLAELTRLRRACCHPRLVTDEPPVDSAKLRAFAKLVDELRTGGHRSLVFSQFVGHLALIREYLDKHNISYQYLDGSTSVKQRQAAVDRFQAGEGDLFLISLKAGNSGLNLTAADYVIHMDPWWNPAVEDQASDRAYRMGQTKPVTIYRLVIKGSIEEKIVQLHAQKRELSDALLEGTDTGLKLSVDELMDLVEPER